MAAWEEDNGTLVLMGSMQCPYYVHKAMLLLFPREPRKKSASSKRRRAAVSEAKKSIRTCSQATRPCCRSKRNVR